jgi:hypothetical protein
MVGVMILVLKEVVQISPFVFVHVEFRNVSGEPRLVRPALSEAHETLLVDAGCMQAIGWYLSRRCREVQKAKRMDKDYCD